MKLQTMVNEDYDWLYADKYAVVSDYDYIIAIFCRLSEASDFITVSEQRFNIKYRIMKVIEE